MNVIHLHLPPERSEPVMLVLMPGHTYSPMGEAVRLADWLESSLPEMTMERLLDVLVDRWAVKQGEV